MTTCLILHNMLVSDRVMGDIDSTYAPSSTICIEDKIEYEIEQLNDLEDIQQLYNDDDDDQ